MDKTPKSVPGLLTLTEAAEYLGVHPETLRLWAKTGLVPCGRLGPRRDFRFRVVDLEEFAFRENPCFRGTPGKSISGEKVA